MRCSRSVAEPESANPKISKETDARANMLRGSHKPSQKNGRVALLLFFGIYLFSGLSRIGTSFDSRWTVYVAESIWNHHDTNLDEYEPQIRESGFYSVQCIDAKGHDREGPPEFCNGHWYDSYPIGGKVLATPLIIAAVDIMRLLHPLIGNLHSSQPVIEGFLRADYDVAHPLIEMEVASAFLAATAVMMFFIALQFLPVKRAVWLTLLFALATSAYSIAGRAVWQHTPSILLLTIILYLLIRAEEKPYLAAWVGLCVALAYTVRPTDSLWVILFTAYVAIRFTRYLAWYLLAAAPVATIWIAYNLSIYHYIFSPYYRGDLPGFQPENWGRMAMALAGNLISPSRGLLIFTPVFIFAIWAMVTRKKRTDYSVPVHNTMITGSPAGVDRAVCPLFQQLPLAPWLIAAAVAHWIVVSAYVSNWWAGHSYGPRFFTDITPIFVLFLIPYLMRWDHLSRLARTTFITLALIGFAIHVRGGWSMAVIQWNVDPTNIDQHPERNWDYSDPPFLRWRVKDMTKN